MEPLLFGEGLQGTWLSRKSCMLWGRELRNGKHFFRLNGKTAKLHQTFQFWFAQLRKKTELDSWVVN